MNIGQAAKLSGISAKMIRYYEQTGLIPKARRSDAGYRHYSSSDVESFHLIRRARDLGFSTEQISALLILWRDSHRTSADVKLMALTHLSELKEKITELQDMAHTLEQLTQNCHGNDQPDCPIITSLIEPTGKMDKKGTKLSQFNRYKPVSTVKCACS
ncbi:MULTISPECIES: Cu(I)-responsive transcriptional regulator [Providencia]|uniref:Cu(I)-responsive transcriptional regulator n=1 Tax=Providencia TaxID=586 RepID=UPI0008386BD1|nr:MULTISPECIES: Cu(I)-responsive transcriptional regulator [Providencia]MBP6122052.1 Cu(I)-responsive transcriptional regulator [Providencia sp.]NIH24165.1 Cu(I)-responsive transcriptional regulator [Providencia heimbachae]QCJ71551.1 Cu(I)-responsive transcriptional regulator [Providencia heimbachae]